MAGAGRAASALMGSARDSGCSGDAGGEGRARASRSRRICCCSCWILSASLQGEKDTIRRAAGSGRGEKRTPSDVRQGRGAGTATPRSPRATEDTADQRLTGLRPEASQAG